MINENKAMVLHKQTSKMVKCAFFNGDFQTLRRFWPQTKTTCWLWNVYQHEFLHGFALAFPTKLESAIVWLKGNLGWIEKHEIKIRKQCTLLTIYVNQTQLNLPFFLKLEGLKLILYLEWCIFNISDFQ